MATTKDDLGDKHVETASAEVGEASGTGDDIVVEGNTKLSLTDKDLVVTSEQPRATASAAQLTPAGPSKKRRTCGVFPARRSPLSSAESFR